MLRTSFITLPILLIVGLLATVPFHAQQPPSTPGEPQSRSGQAGGRGGGGAAQGAGGASTGSGQVVRAIDERTSGMQKIDGYFPIYWDERTGSVFLEIPRLDTEFLLSTGLAAGLGSNDIGLDRGQGGQGRVVKFERIGPKVLLTGQSVVPIR
jgi:hypothetical protein